MLWQPEAIEAAEAVVLLQGAFCIHRAEGVLAIGVSLSRSGHQAGRSARGRRPRAVRGLLLGQLLVQGAALLSLHHPHLAGAHIGAGQAQRLPPLAGSTNHRRQPVVAAGAEHALFQHRAGGQHPGDVLLEQAPLVGVVSS